MFKRNTIIVLISSFFILIFSVMLIAYPGGITGRTHKTSTTGCSCHTLNTAITGSVTGPDTVLAGSSTVYTITITRSGYSGSHGGVDIATRLGTLSPNPSSSLLQLLNSELTHISALSFSSGTASAQFTYIAPSNPGTDTIFSTVAAGYSNGWNWSPEKRVIVRNPSGVINNQTASVFNLEQNYPNPFNPSTMISFSLPKESYVTLNIYDVLGNKVDNLVSGKMTSGNHEISWNATNFSSGIYFYTLKTGENTMTKKMILAK